MFAPLSILSIIGSRAATEDRTIRPLVDYSGFNLNIGSLTGDEAGQAAYAAAVVSLLPQDNFKYMRNNMYGLTYAVGAYPPWMSTAASYFPNMFRRTPPADYHNIERRLIAEPLAGFANAGIGPAGTPFGRDAAKLTVSDAANTWRTNIRWRLRVMLSSDVGAAVAPITTADIIAVQNTTAKTVQVMGPNEIDAIVNWKQYYLDFTNNPDEITTATPFANIVRADTVFSASLALLFLRVADHMKHTWEATNDAMAIGGAGRTDCAVLAPSIIRCATGLSSNTDFTIYDWFLWEDMTANVLMRRGEWLKWCDAIQIHIHVDQSTLDNPWIGTPTSPLNGVVAPWHYWTAKLANESYRSGLGLDPYPRPVVETETGIPTQGGGVPVDGRHDLNQLRAMKYGILATSALYWGCTEILFYALGLSSAYGYNLMHIGGLKYVSTFNVSPSARGTGYVVGTVYALNYGSGNSVRPTFKVTSIGSGGSITGLEIQYTGYVSDAAVASAQLVAPGGGTAATLNLTWTTVPRFTREGEVTAAPNPPAQAISAGASTLFFNDDFETLDFYHQSNNPNGKWRFIDYWQSHEQAGYIDFGGGRTFMVNQMTTGTGTVLNQSDTAAASSIQPYLPASQLDSTTMRLTAQRALLASRAALRTTVNAITTVNQGLPADTATWLGAFMTTERFVFDTRYDFRRPAYIEFRIRFTPANINGVFSSIWLYSAGAESHPAGDGKDTVEIDMFESDDIQPGLWKTNIHKDKGPASGGLYANIPLTHTSAWIDGNFHTYGMLWEPNSLKIYRDNVLSNSLTGVDADWFNVPMRLMITHTVDPNWAAGLNLSAPAATSAVYLDIDRISVWRA